VVKLHAIFGGKNPHPNFWWRACQRISIDPGQTGQGKGPRYRGGDAATA